MEHALEHDAWRSLKPEELDFLKEIVRLDSYAAVMKRIISRNIDFYWPILERLERKWIIDL